MVRSFERRRVAQNLIPRKPVGQRMVGPLAARGRDATAEADLAEALRRSRLTAQREKRKRAAADRRSFNVACTLSGLRAELDRREQRRQEAQYAEQLHEVACHKYLSRLRAHARGHTLRSAGVCTHWLGSTRSAPSPSCVCVAGGWGLGGCE